MDVFGLQIPVGITDPNVRTQSGTGVLARGRQWLAMFWVVGAMSLVLVAIGDRHDFDETDLLHRLRGGMCVGTV